MNHNRLNLFSWSYYKSCSPYHTIPSILYLDDTRPDVPGHVDQFLLRILEDDLEED